MITRASSAAIIRRVGRAALFPFAALIVHQLRFALAFGGHAGTELAQQGHSYLHSLVPWVVLLLGIATGAFLWGLGRALAGQRTLQRYTISLAALWLVCATCLVAIYIGQEALEGVFATGHPAGLAGIFAYGGWWAVPAAACVGLVLATIFHGARWVLDEITQRRRASGRHHALRRPARITLMDGALPRLSPLADGWSDRGPPS